MKPNESKNNVNIVDDSDEPNSSSALDKTKPKRKILNPFKRLSLKRTKSYGNRYSLFKSESDLNAHADNAKFVDQLGVHSYNENLIQAARLSYSESNPFYSEANIPYSSACTSHTISQSLVIIPKDSPGIRNFEVAQNELVEERPVNLIFNPSELPPVSGLDRNINNKEQTYITKQQFDTKTSQTSKTKNIEKRIKKSVNDLCNIVSTNLVSNKNNNLNIYLSFETKELLDITNYLQENELQLKHLISKYIRNENFQQELLQAVSSHAKIQIENERRAHKLAQEMLLQESEALRTKEKGLQNSLDVVVQINRLLEEEIESLKTENEKIIIDYDTDSASCTYHKKYEEDILRNNNELRARLKHLVNEIKRLETDLKNIQAQNDCLVNQLANTNSQVRRYKDAYQKSMGDHEIEQAAFVQQLSDFEQNVKASIDAGDTLLEDLEAVKRQLTQMPFELNWSKFKCRGNTVVDLLHLARSSINELCRELIKTYTQISFRNKDSETQNMEIKKLNQELNKIKSNDIELQFKVEDLSSLEIQLQVEVQKTKLLESELEMSKKENFSAEERLYHEKSIVDTLIKDIEDFNTQLSTKDLEISSLNTKIFDIITENSSLKCQIDAMKKLLDESKLSKVLTELLETQEKCAYFQAQYYQVELEKNNLVELSKKFDVERENLIKYQQSYYEHLQLQQKDIAELNQENHELKHQLKLQEEYLFEKNNQIFQQINETNIMKTVQSQFTSEVTKNQVLESNALNTNFEMNRLTVVAEYNNMISQQLKSAIDNKDKIISELKCNLEKLSLTEKKNVEEKTALFQEITEAAYVVKQLKNDLKDKNEKFKHLSDEKTDTEKKIEELHKMLTDERQVARELINDHKNLTTQRNNLLSQQKEYLSQVDSLKANENKLKLLNEQYETKCLKCEERCEILTKELHETNKKIELKHQKAKDDVIEYENKLSLRDHNIEKLKAEKEEFENTVKYLQNNIQKLRNEIDDLRNIEKEYKDQLTSNLESILKFQKRTDEQRQILEQCSSQQILLEQKLSEALMCNNELLNEYNSFIKDSRVKEEKLLKDIKSYKKLNETKTKSIECLATDSKVKIKLLEQRQTEYNTLKEHLQNFEEIQKDLDEKSRLLENSLDSQHKLNEKISKLVPENENSQKKIKELSNIVNLLQSQLDISAKNREKEIEICKSFIEEITTETRNQKQEMLTDLHGLSTKLSDLNSKYSEKCSKYENLKTNYKDLAIQLSTSVSVLLQEKILRQNREVEVESLNNKMKELTSKLDCTNNYITELTDMKTKADTIFIQGDSLQNELDEARKLYTTAKIECKTLEVELQETTEKLKRLEQFSDKEEGYLMKELENRAELLQKAESNVDILENRVRKLRQQMQSTNDVIIQLKSEISHLYQKIQILEFQKCELTLRYHELSGKYLSEKNLNATLKESHQHLLSSVCEHNTDRPLSRSVSQSVMLGFK